MQPYQEASEEHTKQSYRPFETAASVGGLGLKGAIGGRIMSMLNKYVPENLVAKGLAKIDPRLGKFVSLAEESGHSIDESKQFIEKQVTQAETQEQPKENRNIIQQESPELHDFIKQHVASGRGLYQAGAVASKDNRFIKAIKKLTKAHKLSWGDLLEQVYGPSEIAGNNGKSNSVANQEVERFNQVYGQKQPQQTSGKWDQAKKAFQDVMQM